MLTRRDSLMLAGAAVLAGCAPGLGGDVAAAPPLPPDRQWLARLGQGLPAEVDYPAVVEGRLPDRLAGTLYRNGPGLFERDGFRKWTLLDGDGLIRATRLSGGRAQFTARFVRTEKFRAEDRAGRFLYPTWTTPAPGFFDNIPGIPGQSQAGVTPVVRNGQLYAFDEVGLPYVLDPRTLETVGSVDPAGAPDGAGPLTYKAHTKIDAATGNWILVGSSDRMSMLHAVVQDPSGRRIAHTAVRSPRSCYFHDVFWTGRRVVFHLQPALFPQLPLGLLTGASTYADSLDWRPEAGSVLLVVDPMGAEPPVPVEANAGWMWHTLNACEQDGEIVADYVGYDTPDHFLGPQAVLRTVMQGRAGVATSPGTLRRLVINTGRRRARVETVADGHFEFPIIHPARAGRRHRFGYMASGRIADSWFHDGVARIDTASGSRAEFRFGPQHYVGEPVFARDPAGDGEDQGWLLCEVLDGAVGTSFIAVFDAAQVADGPVAQVRLRHHLPFSFHGWWQA